jgi:hypothetical protein
VLPPIRWRTNYVVDAGLGRMGASAGRADIFIVEASRSGGHTETGPLLVRRLIPVAAPE